VRRIAYGVAGLLLLAGCGNGGGHNKAAATPSSIQSGGQQMGARGQLGALQLSGAYVPEPASPDVAAAYVTVHNTGRSADSLVRASTPAGRSATLHRDVTSGGSDGMVSIGSIPIPAGQTVAMKPGGMHLMIEHPRAGLKRGGQVSVTLVFTHAGRLTMQVPILSPAGLMGDMPSSMPDMPDMPGMNH